MRIAVVKMTIDGKSVRMSGRITAQGSGPNDGKVFVTLDDERFADSSKDDWHNLSDVTVFNNGDIVQTGNGRAVLTGESVTDAGWRFMSYMRPGDSRTYSADVLTLSHA